MRLRRDPSIAGENSINFELNFQILSDDRGPGPLTKYEKTNQSLLTFPERLMHHDEGAFWC